MIQTRRVDNLICKDGSKLVVPDGKWVMFQRKSRPGDTYGRFVGVSGDEIMRAEVFSDPQERDHTCYVVWASRPFGLTYSLEPRRDPNRLISFSWSHLVENGTLGRKPPLHADAPRFVREKRKRRCAKRRSGQCQTYNDVYQACSAVHQPSFYHAPCHWTQRGMTYMNLAELAVFLGLEPQVLIVSFLPYFDFQMPNLLKLQIGTEDQIKGKTSEQMILRTRKEICDYLADQDPKRIWINRAWALTMLYIRQMDESLVTLITPEAYLDRDREPQVHLTWEDRLWDEQLDRDWDDHVLENAPYNNREDIPYI